MTEERVGKAIYEADVDTSKLSDSLHKADDQIRQTGASAEKAFSQQATASANKYGGAVDALKGKFGEVLKTLKEPQLASGLLQGVGLGAGLLAFGGITSVIQGAGDMLGELANKGAEAQATEAKLDAALKANVPGWQAHTQEIEAAARAGEKLGFTDDQIKESLASLVVHTHDVTKAIQIQQAAMDLARFKNIDLATASTLLGKAYDGSTGALKKMGIELPKGAKGLQAIADAEQSVAGQAQAFANTDLGQKSKLSASLDAIEEKLGGPVSDAFAAITSFIAGPVVDAVTGLIDKIGNLGSAFNDLHRLIDPNLAVTQDMEAAIRKQAEAMGLDADAAVAFYEAQQKATQAQQANAKATLDTAIIAAHAADATLSYSDIATKLGTNIDEVSYAINVLGTGWVASNKALQDNTNLTQSADGVVNQYKASIKSTSQAIDDQHSHYDDLNTAVKQGTTADIGALKAKQEAARAFGQYGEVVGKTTTTVDAAAKAQAHYGGMLGATTTSVIHDMRNFEAAWRGGWINVVDRLDLSAGNIHQTLAGMKKDTNQQLTQLEYDLSHPHQKEHTLAYLVKAMNRAQADLITAENSGDADLIKEAQAAVASIQAEYNKLNGNVTLTTHFTWKGGEGTGTRTGGGVGVRASGGPIWPGDWIVGEHGPERMRITSSGMGYVWPNKGGGGSPSTMHHTFGPITVRVEGSSPEVAHAAGRGIGETLSGVLVELKRMSTQPVGSVA